MDALHKTSALHKCRICHVPNSCQLQILILTPLQTYMQVACTRYTCCNHWEVPTSRSLGALMLQSTHVGTEMKEM